MARINISAQLRQRVSARANNQCEYCLLSERDSTVNHTIDHIRALKHGGTSDADNLALACVVCNRNKGSDIATIDPENKILVRLFDPRRDIWQDHFMLDGANIVGLTPSGRGTVSILQFNEPTRVQDRAFLQAKGHFPTD
ncbi:Restriction endonuclease [Candidatus Promineifilum breve]|uniref:Restriction endonuclease n=1 Tax=Candidatus Promineifilum breve TaxID=1806508 RepID=A0A160T6P3_9CHLR|nr:Restriction endonuclease [Candidatus Promineifilum breve]